MKTRICSLIFVALTSLCVTGKELDTISSSYSLLADTIDNNIPQGKVRVTLNAHGIADEDGKSPDWYFGIVKDFKTWKVDTVGRLDGSAYFEIDALDSVVLVVAERNSSMVLDGDGLPVLRSEYSYLMSLREQHHLTFNVTIQEYPMIISDKPVIYVYPNEKTDVSIQLGVRGDISFSYPKYDGGWNFTADPSGEITLNNRTYHYLFWEGLHASFEQKIDWSEGFVVSKNDTEAFLEEKLKELGLSQSEYNEFIVYWAPRMKRNHFNTVHFLVDEEYDELIAGISVVPKPDSMRRVFMVYKPSLTEYKIKEQDLESFIRKGYTVIEWGGSEIKM